MKRLLLASTFLLLINFVLSVNVYAQKGVIKQVKLINFDFQSSSLVKEGGGQLSSPDYRPSIYWLPVKVPSTVLTVLVANHIYPDPYQGLNNMLIPDASDQFNKDYNLEQYSHLPNDPN